MRISFLWLFAPMCTLACAGVANGKTGISALDTYPPGVVGTTTIHWYDVHGRTAAAVDADMRRQRSGTSGGYFADTRSPIRWRFRTQQDGPTCSVVDTHVYVEADVTLPRWTAPANVEPGLEEEWHRFIDAVERHEAGHKDIAARAGQEIVQRLDSLRLSCAALDDTVTRVTRAIVSRERSEQRQYDIDTMHGAIQGATFHVRRG